MKLFDAATFCICWGTNLFETTSFHPHRLHVYIYIYTRSVFIPSGSGDSFASSNKTFSAPEHTARLFDFEKISRSYNATTKDIGLIGILLFKKQSLINFRCWNDFFAHRILLLLKTTVKQLKLVIAIGHSLHFYVWLRRFNARF